ncbi:hypothetical protein DPMN_181342 [Dreissena polymorpha]|uniref:C-type lectin domain-containing protein n=1 Tax=Dreissena polymorpha TaxID=45954 RepID=A0A9D4DCN9_DREPO|nr:hypothetical protein DPMN_181342 [Dreissena polymorpha]
MGAHVVIPDDDDENIFIRNMSSAPTTFVWIGIEKEVSLNTLLSSHDNKAVTYVRWRNGEPNGHTYELCLIWIHLELSWDDAPCHYTAIVACEKELGN